MNRIGTIGRQDIISLNTARKRVFSLSQDLGFSRIRAARIASVFSDMIETDEEGVILSEAEVSLGRDADPHCLVFRICPCEANEVLSLAENFSPVMRKGAVKMTGISSGGGSICPIRIISRECFSSGNGGTPLPSPPGKLSFHGFS